METKIIQDVTKFIKSSIKLDYYDEAISNRLTTEYGEEIHDFSSHFIAELKRDTYKEFLERFDVYGPLLFKKFKIKPESTSWDDPDYSTVFYELSEFFEGNDEFLDLCRVFHYCINSLSAHINPGSCNYHIEEIAKAGKLHLIQIHCKDALTYLWENDSDYFYDRLEEHINACNDRYPERIEVFKKTKLYKSWLEDREES